MTPLAALQETLAAEHAAVFVYGDLGAHTSQSGEPELFDLVSMLYRTHRARRDRLRTRVIDLGGTPVAAEASYDLPRELRTPAAVRRHAIVLEQGCAEVYAALVASTALADRAWAIAALREAATARVLLGGEAQAFPGAPELG